MTKWISVEDRLPEYTTQAGGIEFVHVIGHGRFGPHEVMYCNGEWTSQFGPGDKITHWMPLPEPPE